MQLREVITIIEKTAPLFAAASWDMSGVQVAAHNQEIMRLAVCLDPIPAAIEVAVMQGANMVLTHHPLLLKPRLPARLDAYHAVLSLLFQNDICLYAAHTSLDVNLSGPAGWLADVLHFSEKTSLEATADIDGHCYGFGCCGQVVPLTFEDLLAALRPHITLDTAVVCGPLPQTIQRVAYCTGSGASLLTAASRHHTDVYITGDVKYHAALETEICVLDVGHHSLEEEMMRRFAQDLTMQLLGVDVIFIPSISPFHPVH